MAWLSESGVLEKWRQVHEGISDEEVPAVPFITAARSIISLFDLISGMGIVKSDMLGNADQLSSLTGGREITLQALVRAELEGADVAKLVKNGKTASCALLWLTRCVRHRCPSASCLHAPKAQALLRTPFQHNGPLSVVVARYSALQFIAELLREMAEKPGAKLSECINAGYARTLKQYHGFAVRTTFQVSARCADCLFAL